MAGNENIIMGQLFAKFFQQVQQQGFSITLLVGVVIYFHIQNTNLQSKVDNSNNKLIEAYEDKMNALETVISKNTLALDRIYTHLQARDQD